MPSQLVSRRDSGEYIPIVAGLISDEELEQSTSEYQVTYVHFRVISKVIIFEHLLKYRFEFNKSIKYVLPK